MPSHDRSSRRCLNNPWISRSPNESGLSPAHRLRFQHSDDIRDQIFRSASLLVVLDAVAVLALEISGFEIDVRRQSHARWAFGTSDSAHPILSSVLPQLTIYPYILCFFVSSCPQPRTVPRLLAWWSGTLGWHRHSTIPRSRVRFSDGRTYFNWSWEIIRKRGGCRFLSTWRGGFFCSLLGQYPFCYSQSCFPRFDSAV